MAERSDAANPATWSVRYVDPQGLNQNPAFTNVVVVEGPVRTICVGGQALRFPNTRMRRITDWYLCRALARAGKAALWLRKIGARIL